MTALLVRGVRESATVNGVMVVDQGRGRAAGHRRRRRRSSTPSRFTPLVPPNTGTFGEFGWSGVMRGAAVIFFAYIGFDAVSTAAQEARNPQRDMPIGILGSLAICTVLYVAVAAVMVGLVPYARAGRPGADGGDRSTTRAQAARGTALEGLLSVMPFLVKIAHPRRASPRRWWCR